VAEPDLKSEPIGIFNEPFAWQFDAINKKSKVKIWHP
jgi:hypothetical protein